MDKKFTKNVKTYIQILPEQNECWDDIKILEDQKTIYARSIQDFSKGRNTIIPNYWTFRTDGVLYNLNPTQIFDKYVKESLKKAVSGIDILIFAYGQTGTGKSSTINGLQNNFESRGLTPRIITELFDLKESFKYESNIKYSVSYVEITKLFVLDLLKKDGNTKVHNPYKTLEIIEIKTEKDGLKFLFQGESQRNISHNKHISNILTSVFTIHVRNISRTISNPIEKCSKIHIIDMAGIDTGGSLTCEWKKAKEVGIANLNKSQLEQCLMAIHIDVIKSKTSIKDAGILVDYLRRSLNAESIIRFIGHIRTTRESLLITLSILRFANYARKIKSAKQKPVIAECPELLLQNLKTEVEYLKHQMYLNSMLMNENLSYNITQSRMQQMESAVEEFVKSNSDNLALLNITDAKIAVNMFKKICTTLAEEIIVIRKQIPSELKISTSVSKGSATSTKKIEEKISKTSKKSQNSQSSVKKRKSSDRSSRLSKLSIQSKSKVNPAGSLTKSGITIGQLLSYDFEGDATKTLKPRSKSILRPSLDKISEEINEKKSLKAASIGEINLQTDLGDDFVEVWNAYQEDENYNFKKFNTALQSLEVTTKAVLKEFYVQLDKLQDKVQRIDGKKNDLLRIQLFKDSNLQCGSVQSMKLDDSIEQIAVKIIELINNTVELKEGLLKLQSDLKVNIDEYHRIKNNIMKNFTDYCVATFKVELPSTEQIVECIEDKLNYHEKTSTESTESKDFHEKCAFYKYQTELKKTQQKKLEEYKTEINKNKSRTAYVQMLK